MASTTPTPSALTLTQRRRVEARLHTGSENVPWSGCAGLGGGPDDALPCGCPSWVWLPAPAVEDDGPVVDGPRPTLLDAGVGYIREEVFDGYRGVSIPCRKGCVVAAPHSECLDAEGDVLG